MALNRTLVELEHASLRVPIFLPADRQLTSNPIRFISDLYLGNTRRGIANLLEDINLTVEEGERVGVIGENGAGKSSLLRLIAGIYSPSNGTVRTLGSVRGLFDVTLGMNQQATGLENIYMRGLQLGYTIPQTKSMVPEILDFCQLHEYIEQPLYSYSSGMRLRLAVAVNTARSPDVLLLDEWIGTGDAVFREKLKNRMEQMVEDSHAMILATHNIQLMKSLCTRGVVVSKGRIVFQGGLQEAQEFYQSQREVR